MPILVAGASGHAKVVLDVLARAGGVRVVGLLGREPRGTIGPFGLRVLGTTDEVEGIARTHGIAGVALGIGDNDARERVALAMRAAAPTLALVSAIHPSAVIAEDVTIGSGTAIMAGAVVNPGTVIGVGCVLNTRASLDHDCVLGDFASLAPGAITGGDCHIGSRAWIGIGAVVVQGRRIGNDALIGAGATVLEDVGACEVRVGTPARVLRVRAPGTSA